LLIVRGVARASGFCREDEVAAVFCGSQKSLVAGIPIASVMFPSTILGVVVLPIMIYHPLQLVVGAWLARRYANQLAAESDPGGTSQASCPAVVA
jgi:sodium/bile acid cotransporter 7